MHRVLLLQEADCATRKLRASREEARLREARENDNEEGDDLDDDDEMEL